MACGLLIISIMVNKGGRVMSAYVRWEIRILGDDNITTMKDISAECAGKRFAEAYDMGDSIDGCGMASSKTIYVEIRKSGTAQWHKYVLSGETTVTYYARQIKDGG